MRVTVVLSLLALSVISCSTVGANGAADMGSPDAALGCAQIAARVEALVEANRTCSKDDDCTFVATNCGLPYCCGAAVNQQVFGAIEDQVNDWFVRNCMGECLPCPSPASGAKGGQCVNGTCSPPGCAQP